MPGRRLSGTERAWLAADRLCPPFVNQQLIEGTGTLDFDLLADAVARAAAVQPGVRLRLRGWLGATRWSTDGPPPLVTRIEGDDTEALARRLDPRHGPIAEVLLLDGPRVVFRTHHAALDGRGAGLFSADVFRALRGEPLLGALAGPLTDVDLTSTASAAPPAEAIWRAPMGIPTEQTFAVAWRRRRISGPTRQLLPRALSALHTASLAHGDGPLRVGIPVDLRRHRPGLRASGNLTGIAHLVLDGGDPAQALTEAIDGDGAAAAVQAAAALRGVPLWLMAAVGGRHARQGLKTGRFSTSATLSNLGRQDLVSLSGGGFQATGSLWIPPGQPGLPLFLTLSGDQDGFDLTGSAPVGLASEGRLDQLLDAMAAALS
ncbi:MAG: hypothetical protein ACI8S6_000173 [Myxococcota bacterium]